MEADLTDRQIAQRRLYRLVDFTLCGLFLAAVAALVLVTLRQPGPY